MLLRAIHGKNFVLQLHADGRATCNGLPLRCPCAPVVDAAAGRRHYALQCENGELYVGAGTHVRRVHMPGPVISVSCGHEHTTVAMRCGTVVMHARSTWMHVPLPSLATRVYSGNGCSAALCQDGKVYTWGCNRSMQLGRATDDQVGPVLLPSKAVDFGFGHGFGAALLDDGTVHAWGFGSIPRPARMSARSNTRFCRIAVGQAYIASVHMDRTRVTMTGTIGDTKVCRYVQEQDRPVSALTGGWVTSHLRAEYTDTHVEQPARAGPILLAPHRWKARRVLVLCVAREQKRRERKRSRACADGAWSNKLPRALWHEVARYLG